MSPLVDAPAVTFWASAGLVLYAYVGYPVLNRVLLRVFGRKPVPPVGADRGCPPCRLSRAADAVVVRLDEAHPARVLGDGRGPGDVGLDLAANHPVVLAAGD